MRGRGRGMGRGGMKMRPPFIPHVTFDLHLAEPAFPPVKQAPPPNEEAFQAVIITQKFWWRVVMDISPNTQNCPFVYC